MSENTANKEFRYDIAATKTTCVLLVVLVHCIMFYTNTMFLQMDISKISLPADYITRFINATAVEGFFLCSGFLLAKNADTKHRSWFSAFGERCYRILLPYFIWGSLWIVPLYTAFDISCYGRPDHAGLASGYLHMLLGQFADHLWFLMTLFWITLFYLITRKLCTKKLLPVLFLLTVAAALCIHFFLPDFPYYKLVFFPDYVFCFFSGILCYFFRDRLESKNMAIPFAVWGVSAVGLIAHVIFQPEFFVLKWLGFTCGGLFVYFSFRLLEHFGALKDLFRNKYFLFLSDNGMAVYLFNLPIPKLFYKWFSPVFDNHIYLCMTAIIICSFIVILLIVFLYSLFRKFIHSKFRFKRLV